MRTSTSSEATRPTTTMDHDYNCSHNHDHSLEHDHDHTHHQEDNNNKRKKIKMKKVNDINKKRKKKNSKSLQEQLHPQSSFRVLDSLKEFIQWQENEATGAELEALLAFSVGSSPTSAAGLFALARRHRLKSASHDAHSDFGPTATLYRSPVIDSHRFWWILHF